MKFINYTSSNLTTLAFLRGVKFTRGFLNLNSGSLFRFSALKFANLTRAFFIFLLFLFYGAATLQGSNLPREIVLVNQNILSPVVSDKIAVLGEELASKSGVFAGVAVYESLEGKTLKEAVAQLNLTQPYALLMLTKAEHKVEIFADPQTLKLFDKEKILSPYPSSGSILPILASKNGKDIFNAAVLNGYADLAEQIAASKGVALQNAVGNQNRRTLDAFRIFIYGSIAAVVFATAFRKFRRKNG
ncbi:hypothetical protein [uncultured Campylobacter sp.]|uniref:hypothetical protein n=1 Tax=uncultured Campylobacter sp. TaxID=218934 RepID=UPI0026307212|nr:hypothetical protein [uncultured Campylobacter sp.]